MLNKIKEILFGYDLYEQVDDSIIHRKYGKTERKIKIQDIQNWEVVEEEMTFDIIRLSFKNEESLILYDYKNDLIEILNRNKV